MRKWAAPLFTATLAAFGAMLFIVFYNNARTNAIARLNDEQRIHAEQAAHGIETFFNTWTGILTSLAGMEEVIGIDDDGKRFIGIFLEAHKEQIRSITRMDENGVILYTVPHKHRIGSNISNQKHVRNILTDRKPVVSDVFKAVQGFDAVALHVPVFSGAEFRGSIAIVIDFESIAKRYLEVIKIGETGYAWMLSRDGTTLFSPVPGFTGKSVFENSREFPSVISLAKDMIEGKRGEAAYTFDRIGVRTVAPGRKHAVYMPVRLAGTFWSIAVATSEQEVISNLSSFRNRLLIVIGILLACGIVFSALGAKAWLIVTEEARRRKAEDDLRTINEELLAINRIVMSSVTVRDTTRILDLIMDEAVMITGLEGGTICLVGRDETLELAAHRNTSEATIRDLTTNIVRVGECLCGECARDHKPLILPDRESVLKYATREATRGEDIRFHAAFPLVVMGKCLGVLCVFTKTDRKPSDRALNLLKTVTAQIALAVHSTQLYEETVHYAATLEDKIRERTRELHEKHAALMSLVKDMNLKTDELEQANLKLTELDRLKSMFIASMSHELRTPLNSIIGFTGIMLQGLAGPLNDEQRKQLGMVKGSSQHLLDLITDIIDLSKVEAGKISLSVDQFDLVKTSRDVLESLRVTADRKSLELELVAPETLPVLSDARRLRQVLVNLVGNAVKFTEKGGVSVTVSTEGGTVSVAVRDTGPGIKPEDMSRLFQYFSQITSTEMPKHEGTGLGLYLSKKLMNLMGGDILAESEFGVGSVFTVTLPVGEEEPR